MAATYLYSAFGTLRSTTGTLSQPYRFGGGYTDASTGLVKLGIRYYDPTHGRFTQMDPTGQEGNEYLYANGDPIMLNDPKGDVAPLVYFAIVAGIRLAPLAARAAPHIARGVKAGVSKAVQVSKKNNIIRVGPTPAGNMRVSLGPTRKYWERMPPWRQSIQRIHMHMERSKGIFTNHKENKPEGHTMWPRSKK